MELLTSIYKKGNTYTGELTGIYTTDIITFASTIDPSINDITAKTVYDNGILNAPLMLLVHGWEDDYTVFLQATYERFASYGFCVIGIGMRGRNGASGTKDISAREIHDIYDLIGAAKTKYGNVINENKIFAVGYSNGGGITLALGAKFPDKFSMLVDNFGMSDYGYNDFYSWYITNPSTTYTIPMDTYIGSPRTSKRNEYLSRETLNAFANNYRGRIYIFHDKNDTNVSYYQSINIIGKSENLKRNLFSSITKIGDSIRWLHQYPNGANQIIQAENYWKNEGLYLEPIKQKKKDSYIIRGYIVTELFTIFLGDGITPSLDGTNRSAYLTYNVENDSYIITPILETGASDVEVNILQYDGKSATQTVSSETEIIVI